MQQYKGILEIDERSGRIYFHQNGTDTILRILGLPMPEVLWGRNREQPLWMDMNVEAEGVRANWMPGCRFYDPERYPVARGRVSASARGKGPAENGTGPRKA